LVVTIVSADDQTCLYENYGCLNKGQ